MNSIRIKNLRSLKDTGEINVKKINILVGSNSSGKSTFLRVFPLLKQTFNKKINGPILWCGDDDDYVDFGSFEEALNYVSKDKCINLAFEFELNFDNNGYGVSRQNKYLQKNRVEFLIRNSKSTGYDYISNMQYIIGNKRVSISFSEKNEIECLYFDEEEIPLEKTREGFYPSLYDQPVFDISLFPIREIAMNKLIDIFSLQEDDGKNSRLIEEIAIYVVNKKIFKKNEKRWYSENTIKKVEEVYRDEIRKIVDQWSFLFILPNYFAVTSFYLKTYFRNVYYIAPVRATAERYYRLRNAAVNEVDCRGKNLPVFLNSLSEKNFRQFQNWTKVNLGFEVVKTTSEGHVSLKIKKNGQEKAVNLSDTGFGYSQMLPIVTQIWYIAKQIEDEREIPFYLHGMEIPITIVIEQPELHLHPALQAKLIDIISKVTNQGNINFIIETHSETIVNRVGNVISKKRMSYKDVGVIFFEKGFGEDNTTVKNSGYDEEGYLENWPIGFFEPEED